MQPLQLPEIWALIRPFTRARSAHHRQPPLGKASAQAAEVSVVDSVVAGQILAGGCKVVYVSEPGERLHLFDDGTVLVAHPDREPFIIKTDGTREPLMCAEAQDAADWSVWANSTNEILDDLTWIKPPPGPLTFKFIKAGDPGSFRPMFAWKEISG